MSHIVLLTTPSETMKRGEIRSIRNTVTDHHNVTPKKNSTKRTPSSAAAAATATSEKISVYDRLYACRKSPTKNSELPLGVINSGKSPESCLFNNKTKKGELRTRAKRLVLLLQELKSHPRFLKHAPSITSTDDSDDGCCYNDFHSPNGNKVTSSEKKKNDKLKRIRSSWTADAKDKFKDELMKQNVACTHIQRIYRGYCTMTLLATISVIYATIIIQSAYRRHREFVSARAIQCTYRRYRSSQCYQLRIIKKFLEDSKKNEKPFLLKRIFSQSYW